MVYFMCILGMTGSHRLIIWDDGKYSIFHRDQIREKEESRIGAVVHKDTLDDVWTGWICQTGITILT